MSDEVIFLLLSAIKGREALVAQVFFFIMLLCI